MLQYGAVLYSLANKTALNNVDLAQNRTLRILFNLKKTDMLRIVKNKNKLFFFRDLHIYELIKTLAKILRKHYTSTALTTVYMWVSLSSDFLKLLVSEDKPRRKNPTPITTEQLASGSENFLIFSQNVKINF